MTVDKTFINDMETQADLLFKQGRFQGGTAARPEGLGPILDFKTDISRLRESALERLGMSFHSGF